MGFDSLALLLLNICFNRINFVLWENRISNH